MIISDIGLHMKQATRNKEMGGKEKMRGTGSVEGDRISRGRGSEGWKRRKKSEYCSC